MTSPGASSVPASIEPSITASAPGGDRLRDVSGVADAAVGDHRDVLAGERLRGVVDSRYLGHADAGDDTGRADRPGPDAELHRIRARIDERERAVAGRDVPGDDLDLVLVP